MAREITVTKTTTETITVPELDELRLEFSTNGPGGEPPNRGIVIVNGEQLCYADELPNGGNLTFEVLRQAVYAMFCEKLGVPVA